MHEHNLAGNDDIHGILKHPEVRKAIHVHVRRLVREHDVEDVVSDTYVEALKSLPTFDRQKSNADSLREGVKRWLYTIAGRVIGKKWRRNKRENEVREDVQNRERGAQEVWENTSLPDREDKILGQLHDLLGRLRPDDRQIIDMWFYQGKGYDAIKKEFGIETDAAARQRLKRAIDRGGEEFGKEFGSNDAREALKRGLDELRRMVKAGELQYEGELSVTMNNDFRLYLCIRYLDAIDDADYGAISAIWDRAIDDPHLAETLDMLDEQIEAEHELSLSQPQRMTASRKENRAQKCQEGPMTRYWALRIAQDDRQFWQDEISNGRLRFGWGYKPEQDLRVVRDARQAGLPLTPDQSDTWKRGRRFLDLEPDGMQVGDIVVIPHLVQYGLWSLVRVTGGYNFRIPPIGDYGHIRVAEYAIQGVVNPYDEVVAAALRSGMKSQLPLWSLDAYRSEVQALLAAACVRPLTRVPTDDERLIDSVGQLRKTLCERIFHHWEGAQFEKPIWALLTAIYGRDKVRKTAGSNERGADFLCFHDDPLGTTHTAAIQLKMYVELLQDLWPLQQIREAYSSYPGVTSGVVLTTAEREHDDFKAARSLLEQEIGIPVRVICRRELADLLLAHLPRIVDEL